MTNLKEIIEVSKSHFKKELDSADQEIAAKAWRDHLEFFLYRSRKVRIEVTRARSLIEAVINGNRDEIEFLYKLSPHLDGFQKQDFLVWGMLDEKVGSEVPDVAKYYPKTEDEERKLPVRVKVNEKETVYLNLDYSITKDGQRLIHIGGKLTNEQVCAPPMETLKPKLQGYRGIIYLKSPVQLDRNNYWAYPIRVDDFSTFEIANPTDQSIEKLLMRAVDGVMLERLRQPTKEIIGELLNEVKEVSYVGVRIFNKGTRTVLLEYGTRNCVDSVILFPNPVYDTNSIDVISLFFK